MKRATTNAAPIRFANRIRCASNRLGTTSQQRACRIGEVRFANLVRGLRATLLGATWCNDLFSLRKERAHGDMHNLALVLEHEEGIPLQAAVEPVAGLIERDVKGFMALVEALRSFGPETDDAVRCFVAGMRALMRGNLDWSAGSRRYQESEGTEEGPALPTAFA